jgi:Methyltransferase domain
MVRDLGAAAERIRGRRDRRRDHEALRAHGGSIDDIYPIDEKWLAHLHDALGVSWPCECEAEARALHHEIREEFAARGLPQEPGRWCDGGLGFACAVWALCNHVQARVVVETGVARGITSRLVLEGLDQRGSGHLSSIDLPNIDSRFHSQTGIAVPETLRSRWTYLEGPSRRLLPRLLAELEVVDVFIHDSLHTGPNIQFEIEHAWAVLRPGGAVLVDDVYDSLAFHDFVDAARPRWSCVGANADGGYRFGVALKG